MSFVCLAFADSWHLYNDRAVSGASKDTVISYEAYLLFYQKVAAEVRRPPNLNEIASVWLRNLSVGCTLPKKSRRGRSLCASR